MLTKAFSPRGWLIVLCGISAVAAAPRVFNVPEGASDGGDDIESIFSSFNAAQQGSPSSQSGGGSGSIQDITQQLLSGSQFNTHSSSPYESNQPQPSNPNGPLFPSKPSLPTHHTQPNRPSHSSPSTPDTNNPYQTLFSHPAFQTQTHVQQPHQQNHVQQPHQQNHVQQPHQQNHVQQPHQQPHSGQASPNVLNFVNPTQTHFVQPSNPTPGFQQIKTNHGIYSVPIGTPVAHQPTQHTQPQKHGQHFVNPVPFAQPSGVQPTVVQPTTIQSFEESVGSFCRSYIEGSATDQFKCAALSRPECEWDTTMLGTNGEHGACACERDFLKCNDPKCYWAADPSVPSKGECISTAERFYKLLQNLLLKRGKKDFAFRINYNAAPSYGYGYGPHDNLGYTAGVEYKEEDHYPAHLYGYGPYGPFTNRYGSGGHGHNGYGAYGHGGYGRGSYDSHGYGGYRAGGHRAYGNGGYGSPSGYGAERYGSYGYNGYGSGSYGSYDGYGGGRYGNDRYGKEDYGYGSRGYGSGGSYAGRDRYNDYEDHGRYGDSYDRSYGYGSRSSSNFGGRYGSGYEQGGSYSSPSYSSGAPADRYCTNCKKRGEEPRPSNPRSGRGEGGNRREYDREEDGYRN